jgi:hypothetical protein
MEFAHKHILKLKAGIEWVACSSRISVLGEGDEFTWVSRIQKSVKNSIKTNDYQRF